MISLGRLRRENIHKHHFQFYRSLAYFIIGLSSYWDWRTRLEGLNIRKNVKEEIILLAGSDENMQKAIVQGKEYKKDVTFDFLELLGITRHDRKRQRYKPLIENLGKLGITLDIISEEKAQAAWILFVFAIPSLLSQVLFFNLRINL